MRGATIIGVLVLFGCARSAPPPAPEPPFVMQDNCLEPEDERWARDDAYELTMERVLLEPIREPIVLRVVVSPSFQPTWMMAITRADRDDDRGDR